ncbi:unnamed protein product [Dovyalis caffra]|uniref:Uncharacterized protein n=1 Tax=Dovyalis caffra TaxID=77055 RepID=A0AAV1RTU7_9ROSI|nr:unnamed protein product [Dovyalis caffra]
MSAYGISLSLMLLLLANVMNYNEASTSLVAQVNGSATSNEMVPLMEPVKFVEIKMMMNESRRRLNGFQICALCTCCGGPLVSVLSLPRPVIALDAISSSSAFFLILLQV